MIVHTHTDGKTRDAKIFHRRRRRRPIISDTESEQLTAGRARVPFPGPRRPINQLAEQTSEHELYAVSVRRSREVDPSMAVSISFSLYRSAAVVYVAADLT